MRKKRFKKLALFVNSIIAGALVVPGIVSICTDINGGLNNYIEARAEDPFYYAEFTDKIERVTNNNSDIVYATIRAKAKEACKIIVEYKTYSQNAIESIDYVGTQNTEEIEFKGEGEIIRKIGFKSLLTNDTKELLAIRNDETQYTRGGSSVEEENGGYYGRHFKVKILKITYEGSTKEEIIPETDEKYSQSQYSTLVYLPYQYITFTYFNNATQVKYGGEKNDAKYVSMYSRASSGASEAIGNGSTSIDGKKNWKSWGVSGWDGATEYLYDTDVVNFVNTGVAKAYGTVLAKSVDTAGVHSNTDIHFFWGSEPFMKDHFSKFGETKNNDFNKNYQDLDKYLSMYIKVNPDVKGGYRLDGNAVNYLVQGKNPSDKEDRLVHVEEMPFMGKDRRTIYYRLGHDARYWVGTEGALYNTTFFRMYPYNGRIGIGIALYNANKEYDIEVVEPYSSIQLIDDTPPYITDEYTEYDAYGNLNLFIRFSEAVYPIYQKPFLVNVNNIAYQASYKDGMMSDTLVYTIPAEKLEANHQKITSITYELPDKDISDLAWTLDKYGDGYGNYLENTSGNIRTSRIIGDVIDLSAPHLGVDITQSTNYQNSYDIILSANSTAQTKDFTQGTVYYSWDKLDYWTADKAKEPTSYDHVHVLTDEENGSFQVTLANVTPGSYYLHALAVPLNGGKNPQIDYRTFGPYNFDNTSFPATVSLSTKPGEASTLKTKYINLNVTPKDTSGSSLDTIDVVMNITDMNGNVKIETRRIVEDGVIISSLNKVVKYADNTYTYISNIDDSIAPTYPLDTNIAQYITNENPRVDVGAYFVVTDTAGNKTTTNELGIAYDSRSTFPTDVDYPTGDPYNYDEQPAFEGISYTVYKYDTVGDIDFTVDNADRIYDIAHDGAQFSLFVNGEEVKAGAGEHVITLTLGSGIYNIVPMIYGGTNNVEFVSTNINFCLSNGLDDMTTNREKTQDDLVLTNETYQLNDVSYYYYNDASNTVSAINYGATINPITGKYDGGSTNPTFSSIDAAKRYVKYMERQDLFLIEVTELIATALNSGSGSTTYVKAPGETTLAQPGQLWVRYKKNTWNMTSDPYSWAFYFYKSNGKVENGINTTELSSLLDTTINTVTNRIVNNGSITYLVEEDTLSSATNAPYLRSTQMHAYPESATQTMSGTPYVSDLKYAGDANLYKNNVTVLGNSYPLATNMQLSIGNTTSLYYHYYSDEIPTEDPANWTKLNARDGDLLGALFGDRGVYRIKEYDDKGVSTFDVYIDHEQPVITAYYNDAVDQPFSLPDSSRSNYFTARKFNITSLTDTDDLAYVAVFTYPGRRLVSVSYADDFENNQTLVLTNNNYYVQVGDRSGNMTTYTVITSESEFILTAEENSTQTGVTVKVINRDENEIYSYEVYINGELKYTTFAASAFYRETGIYRIVVTDIYGNTLTKTVVHEAPTPEIVWYYYADEDTPVIYDEERISRMKLIEDENNPRITYVNSSARVRAIFYDYNESADIEYEITGISTDDNEYTVSTFRQLIITFNTLKSWTLRVWYSSNPESDRIYIFHADSQAPNYSGTFVGTSYSPVVIYDEKDEVVSTSTFDAINWNKYPKVGDVVTLDQLDYDENGTTTLPFVNGDTISGTQIIIRVTDDTGVKSVSATRDGVAVTNVKYDESTSTIQLSGYGNYVITAIDELNNASSFTFNNIETGLASGYIDDEAEALKENDINYAHDSLVVKTFSPGNFVFLIKYNNEDNEEEIYTFELRYEDGVLTYGRYVRYDRLVYNDDNPPKLIKTISTAEYQPIDGYSLNYDTSLKNTWYPVIVQNEYILEASFDVDGNISYRVTNDEVDIFVETLFSSGKGKLPTHYKVGFSKKVSTLILYSGGTVIEESKSFYISIAKDLTIETSDTDPDITNVKYSYNPIGISKDYTTIYNGSTWTPFLGEEKGYYQIVVTNKYNNVKTYNIMKIDTFGFVIMIHVIDGSDVYYEDQRHEAYSNNSIELIVMSDDVYFTVDGERRSGIYRQDSTVLTLEQPGQYNVSAIGNNGIKEDFYFDITNDQSFVYKDSWITGWNDKALLASEGYTNTRCTVHPEPEEGVIYIDVSVNGELHKLYDAINAQPDKELEDLKDAIGRYGDGTYKVGFRNRYGDLVIKTVYYSATPSLILDRKTTDSPNTYTSYDLRTALDRGFYSNYVLRFSTNSKKYIFKQDGEEYSLDEPRVIEFSNLSGTGYWPYSIQFIDEYGNDVTIRAILSRQDISLDLSAMKIVNVGNDLYTKDDIIVKFANDLNGVVTIDDGQAARYISGYAFYADGKYSFTVMDIAGNRATYTINHKSVNHYSLTDTTNNDNYVMTDGVVNNSSVRFNAYDNSVIKQAFKNGELVSDYDSSTFNSTGHWELLIEDEIGNQSYESFYILNNELKEFNYTAPYGYKVTEVWKLESGDSRTIVPIEDNQKIFLNENGTYNVVVTSTKTPSSFNFSVVINRAEPTATLVGIDEGSGVTARDVSLTGLKQGDVVKVYRNGVLIETATTGITSNSPVITTSGSYRIVITNIQGVEKTYEFVRKPIASASASVFIVVTCVIAIAGLTFGLIHHTKLKTDE